jgi:hypothetical protein
MELLRAIQAQRSVSAELRPLLEELNDFKAIRTDPSGAKWKGVYKISKAVHFCDFVCHFTDGIFK